MHVKTLGHKARNLALAAASVIASGAALAQTAPTIPSAAAQIEAITSQQGGYATVMFALALTAVGIMVGVKWIKRGKGAA